MADSLAEKRQAQLAKEKTPTGGKQPARIKKPVAPPAPKPEPKKVYVPLPELKETCGACGSPLRYVPVNSRVKAVACTKIGCALYRERLKLITLKEVKEVSHAEGNSSDRKD